MILSKPDIEAELEAGRLLIDPSPQSSQIGPISINLKLGRSFTVLKELPGYVPALRVGEAFMRAKEMWETTEDCDSFRLNPGDFVLGHAHERVTMPGHLMGLLEGRSSWARTGIIMHLTAPKIDPGFQGTITLEMLNVGRAPVELVPEDDEPVQLMLVMLTQALDGSSAYGAGQRDIFQGQDKPLPRRAEKGQPPDGSQGLAKSSLAG